MGGCQEPLSWPCPASPGQSPEQGWDPSQAPPHCSAALGCSPLLMQDQGPIGWTVYFSRGLKEGELLKWFLEQVCGVGVSAFHLDSQDSRAVLRQ